MLKRVLIPLMVVLFSIATASAQDAESLANQAKEKRKAEKYKDAVQLYSQAIKLAPDNHEFYLGRGKCLMSLGKLEEGFSDITMAIQKNPKYVDAYMERATIFYHLQEADRSILDYSEALKHCTVDTVRHHILLNRASSKLLKRDFNGAIRDCEEVLKEDSLNLGALNNIAVALDEVGRQDETLGYLKKIISIDSSAGYAFMNIGFYLSSHGSYEESLLYFNKAIELSPDLAYNYNNRGYARFMLKDYNEALKDINKSIKMDGSNSYAYRNRGLVYMAMGKDKKACEDWDMALRLGFTRTYGPEVEQLVKENNCLK